MSQTDLRSDLIVSLGHSDRHQQTCQDSEPVSFAAASQSIEGSQRFYRSLDRQDESQEVGHERPQSAHSERLVTLEETRDGALHTLALCRNVIITLELTRLRKSRTGFSYWMSFWARVYERPLARSLCSHVAKTLNKVDALFRAVSQELQQLTSRMEHAVAVASSEKEILYLLERMEEEVSVRQRRRRQKAQSITEKMRAKIEAIPVRVTDTLFDDLKRGVFALDVFCDYHPGDPVAEANEMLCGNNLEYPPHPSLGTIGPYDYRRMQESQQSATLDAFMPLATHPGNSYYHYVERLMNQDDSFSGWTATEGFSTDSW
ncbi:hypothetical protein CNMCM8980_000154 [Aspergillus fumigatiaffinis]|uniref:Uncharacterized protein n=1 Tax=Aspergillus fumigatiaffinis TaxID=340414 RepID=A0A8H4GFI4_9EURO|nr:hypothetical protein CNMCM5878_000372 [Aspergillus fumigatiaffinis]KAF4220579.1 hypothetical protein CNMCM6457_002263 [Aspergillus fumigatiaffinis]KAF4228184.1 hypothetical protein CNMCM6805_002302 [Aspergillus fumigatiaffinis]KAF4243184.1 hypothetical protein CNMCM8980_000154 [Aspergillus fumigatiaffinis]